ncbi:hypothetical protein [Streptosporangium minutum]|uniref:hypothetical protein n=1 Tax=Streptosporangium minutum TaxID=569862 RepID=UPI0013FD8033|nr:hypothetical protein [Streptosporangium minutum]
MPAFGRDRRHRAGGYAEPPPLPPGQDLAFLQDLAADYTAADVAGHPLGTGRDERTTP